MAGIMDVRDRTWEGAMSTAVVTTSATTENVHVSPAQSNVRYVSPKADPGSATYTVPLRPPTPRD